MVPPEAAAAGVTPPNAEASAVAPDIRTAADEHLSLPSQQQQQQEGQEHVHPTRDIVLPAQQQGHYQEEQAQAPATGAGAADAASSPSPLPPPPPPPPTHRLKHVQLPGGRSVPVVMQSENGPCPLLAIANVLLLRGNIYLPPGASEVTQVRPARALSQAWTVLACISAASC